MPKKKEPMEWFPKKKSEPKPEPKPMPKAEPKLTPKPMVKPKPETKAETKPMAKPMPKTTTYRIPENAPIKDYVNLDSVKLATLREKRLYRITGGRKGRK